jgi:2-methylcitrate dehydratase PrpD
MPYCLARASLEGSLGLNHFIDEKVQDSRVQTLMERVIHNVDPEILKKGYSLRAAAKIIIELKNGQIFERTVDRAKGDPENPLTFEELAQKFRICAQGIIDDDQTEKVIHLVSKMEDVSNIGEMMTFLISKEIL